MSSSYKRISATSPSIARRNITKTLGKRFARSGVPIWGAACEHIFSLPEGEGGRVRCPIANGDAVTAYRTLPNGRIERVILMLPLSSSLPVRSAKDVLQSARPKSQGRTNSSSGRTSHPRTSPSLLHIATHTATPALTSRQQEQQQHNAPPWAPQPHRPQPTARGPRSRPQKTRRPSSTNGPARPRGHRIHDSPPSQRLSRSGRRIARVRLAPR